MTGDNVGQLQDQLLDLRKRHFTLLSYSRDLEQTKVVEHEHFQKQCEQKDREIINLKSATFIASGDLPV